MTSICTTNVTSAAKYRDEIVAWPSHVHAIQEVSLVGDRLSGWCDAVRQKRFQVEVGLEGPARPAQNSLGLNSSFNGRLAFLSPKWGFKSFVPDSQPRLMSRVLVLSTCNGPMQVLLVQLWADPGGHPEHRQYNESLFAEAFEIADSFRGPALVMGDFNTEPHESFVLKQVQSLGWHDVVSWHAAASKGKICPTNKQNKDAKCKRIDFMFGNSLACVALRAIQTCRTAVVGHASIVAAFQWGVLSGPRVVPRGVLSLDLHGRDADLVRALKRRIIGKHGVASALAAGKTEVWEQFFAKDGEVSLHSWQERCEGFLLHLHKALGVEVHSSHQGRGKVRLLKQRLSPVQGRPARRGAEDTCQEAATHAARSRLKQLRRLEHVAHLVSTGSNPSLLAAVWRRFQTHGVKLFLPTRPLDEAEKSSTECVAHCAASLTVDAIHALWTWCRLRQRSCEDALRLQRRTQFRQALNGEGVKGATKEAWKYVRKPKQQELAFLEDSGRVLADASDINQVLCDLWFPYWKKSMHNFSEDAFEELLQGCNLPRLQVPPLTAQMVSGALKRMSAGTSKGADSWRVEELQALPPPATQELTQVFLEVERTGVWDDSQLWSWTQLIPKLEEGVSSPLPTKQRPIHLLPMLYRVWASARCRQIIQVLSRVAPPCVQGFLKGRSCRKLWLKLAWHLEHRIVHNLPLSGLVLDVVKAFNSLPRRPFLNTMQRVGIPDGILRAWESSLNNMQRCFRIGGGLQPFFRTCNGFPEGDSLSVVPMILCGWLWAAKVTRNPDCISAVQAGERTAIPHVFADNFEVVTELAQKDVLQNFLADSEHFATVLQVELAPRKMFIWSTSATIRGGNQIHTGDGQALQCKLHARELGVHLNFSRTRSNRTGLDRVEEVKAELFRLAHAPLRKPVKAAIVRGKYWARALHGCEVSNFSATTLKTLRSAASRAILGASRDFASNPLVLNLINAPCTDPKGAVMWRRLLAVREYLAWFPAELPAVQSLMQARAHSNTGVGPALYFLQTCDELGWEVRFDAGWEVAGRCGTFSFLYVCVSRLREIFLEDYQDVWTADCAVRKYMQDLMSPEVCLHIEATLALRATLSPSDQGLIDSVLVGASRWCECGALPSGLEHRWLECPLFDEVRARHPEAVQLLPQLPLLTRRYGLIVQNAEEKTVRAQWDLLSTSPAQVSEVPDSAVVFVDGSAQLPAEKRFRKAGFSAVLFSGNQGVLSRAIKGDVPGSQTVPRAECFAGLAGLQAARNVILYSDCQYFVDGWTRSGEIPYSLVPNGDIWQRVDHLKSQAAAEGRSLQVFKVKAHRPLSAARDDDTVFVLKVTALLIQQPRTQHVLVSPWPNFVASTGFGLAMLN